MMNEPKPAAYASTEIGLQIKNRINVASTPDGANHPPVLVFQNNPDEVSVKFTAKDGHASGTCYATFTAYQGRKFVEALAVKLGLVVMANAATIAAELRGDGTRQRLDQGR